MLSYLRITTRDCGQAAGPCQGISIAWRENLTGCCFDCNQAKADRSLLHFLLDRRPA
jgi:hypothetical protein